MAITFENWKKMKPGKHQIVDFSGVVWAVVSEVEDGLFPTFILKTLRRAPEEYCFGPPPNNGEIGILDKNGRINVYLNHPKTKIVLK